MNKGVVRKMKYIRTKDAIYSYEPIHDIDVDGFIVQHNITGWSKPIMKEDIVKITDTIEELCDEFVDTSELKTTNTGGWLYDEFDSDNKCLVYYAEDERRTIPLNEFDDLSKIYGAIWTDKGLQFVARMNSDGDLEKLINQGIIVGNLEQKIKPMFDEETQKKLKALEIIKEKVVNVGLLSRCANAERYNKGICYELRYLTQEEYDLLKEALQ